MLLCGLAIATPIPSALATEQFPPTVVRLKDGKWQVQGGYLGGAFILVRDKDQTKLALGIGEALPKDEYEKYVHKTTAGPKWEDYALAYFITLSGKPHFCIRTWWGRRILIDLESAKQISDRRFTKPCASYEML